MKLPMIGFGTYKLQGNECLKAVEYALSVGYRHIDTASIYYNEVFVGKAIKNSNIPRQDIYLVSKLAPQAMINEESVYKCAMDSLKDLNTDYLDLYLMHWPIPDIDNPENYKKPENAEKRLMAWQVMEKLKDEGKVREIGVSNFMVEHLEHFLENTKTRPYLNQVEFHPYLDQFALLEYCKKHNIILEGYSSLGHGKLDLLDDVDVKRIATKLNKLPSQILLRWSIENGVPVIPKSRSEDRIKSNFEVVGFDLPNEDILCLNKICHKVNKRFCLNPNIMF